MISHTSQTSEGDDENLLISMQRDQFAGLNNTINGIRAAVETGYSQHARELTAKDKLIEELQQAAPKEAQNE